MYSKCCCFGILYPVSCILQHTSSLKILVPPIDVREILISWNKTEQEILRSIFVSTNIVENIVM
jgi:hypothetical protein